MKHLYWDGHWKCGEQPHSGEKVLHQLLCNLKKCILGVVCVEASFGQIRYISVYSRALSNLCNKLAICMYLVLYVATYVHTTVQLSVLISNTTIIEFLMLKDNVN